MYKDSIINNHLIKKNTLQKEYLEAYKSVLNAYMEFEEFDIIFDKDEYNRFEAIVEIDNGIRKLIILQDIGDYRFASTITSKMIQVKWEEFIDKDIEEIEEATNDIRTTENHMFWEHFCKTIF